MLEFNATYLRTDSKNWEEFWSEKVNQGLAQLMAEAMARKMQ